MDAIRQSVRQAAENGVEPYYTNSGDLMLRTGNSRRKLMKGSNPTELGHLFFGTLGRAPPRGYNYGALPYRMGRTEYIAAPGGDRALRRWNPINSTWKYTGLGRSYFETERQEVIVHVPIKVYGKRVNGTTYEFTGHMPVDDDEVSQTYRQGGNINAIKQIVLNRYSENRMHEGARI